MKLRKKIEEIISSNLGNAESAAFSVCELLEDQMGLAGNGWFDDDPEMLDRINDENA